MMCVSGLLLAGCAQDKQGHGRSGRNSIESGDAVQSYLSTVRSELREGKAGLIHDIMRLSPEESEIFWDIYSEYEAEYFELGERRRRLEYDIAEGIRTRSIDNAAAARLAADYLRLREDQTALLRRYHERISKDLSPLRAAQFLQVEHRTGTVVDLAISAEAPMIPGR